MANHVHWIAVPKTDDGLRRAIGEAHRRHSRRVNFREDWRGHLWQGRFASSVSDDPYRLAAARYIELNPVRAKLVVAPSDDRWSSARAHIEGKKRRAGEGFFLAEDCGQLETALDQCAERRGERHVSAARTHRPHPWRRRFPEEMGEEAWARVAAAETACQTSPEPIIMYGVPGSSCWSCPDAMPIM